MGASTIATRARPSHPKFIFRAVVGVLIFFLIVFLAFDFWFYRAVRAALPQRDGAIHLFGLVGPVTVTYDALGVPNIGAANLPDLFFAQGYVTAQDRLWQMDMTRRYASGDLAAVLGPEYVKLDREHRILGLRQVAERTVANMDVSQRAHFEAYAAGVNAYIEQHQKTLPLEFRFLTYFPHYWTVEDSVLVGLSMTEFLNHGLYKDELEKERILAKLGPELTADLFVNSSWRDHPPGTDTTSIEREIPGETTPDEEEDPAPRRGQKTGRLMPEEKPVPRLAALARVDRSSGGPLDSAPARAAERIVPGAGLGSAALQRRVNRSIENRPLGPEVQGSNGACRPLGRRFWEKPPTAEGLCLKSVINAALKARTTRSAALTDFVTALEAAPLPSKAFDDYLHPGSNNWVVSGAHTASGKPLLSNDMHLDLHIPNVWYEAHLTAGDFDVAGVTLPGVPFVISGHNRYIAWGFTNLGPNVRRPLHREVQRQGRIPDAEGWVQPEHRKEIIRVKGKPEVNVDVEVTRHGPIISDIIPGEKRKLALKWVIYDPQASRAAFFAVDSAKNWQEFQAAFSHFGAPGQNVVYADVDGHIGYQATGLIPIRAAGDGSVPVPGDDNSHEWTGYVPYDKLPSVYDPASGIIATANGRITPDGYPYTLSIEWGSPYRTERIYKLLNAKKKLTPPDMLAIQTDIVSAFDRFCAERFVYAVDHTSTASQRAKSAADLMRNWDGTMTIDSAAPTVAYFSRKKLEELLLEAQAGG